MLLFVMPVANAVVDLTASISTHVKITNTVDPSWSISLKLQL